MACAIACGAWIAAEVGGGLLFLAAGVRLWRYEIAPLWFDITSPVVWVFAAALIVPLSVAFDRRVALRAERGRRWVARVAFVATVGPVLEVLINEYVFRRMWGAPLYTYLVYPTFDGSGSLLSPLYYATVLIHVPITDRVLGVSASPRDPAEVRCLAANSITS